MTLKVLKNPHENEEQENIQLLIKRPLEIS